MYFFIELGSEVLRAVLLQPPESRRAYNSEQPGTRIPATEGARVSKGPQECLLNHLFRIVAAPHEPAREVVSRIEMRKDELGKTASPCVYQMFAVHAVESAGRGATVSMVCGSSMSEIYLPW
jgi:hypothetical protein